ncbi:hypothetical protein HK101_008376 [Irineochytrium annulatum]|nr:hypothetical protein HK101_008376 [Irineochytrium annulatum]
MSMCLRVKRQKTTIFVNVEPTDSVMSLKLKLAQILGRGREGAKDLRLQTLGKTPDVYNTLEDSGILEQLSVTDDGILYMTYWISGNRMDLANALVAFCNAYAVYFHPHKPAPASGAWEPVNVPSYEDLNEEDFVSTVDAKGKASA